jgi:hypothetical protein
MDEKRITKLSALSYQLSACRGSEDLFEVYRGRIEYPLDNPPIWRYLQKDGLKSPTVEAVAKFRKAVEEAEKKKP